MTAQIFILEPSSQSKPVLIDFVRVNTVQQHERSFDMIQLYLLFWS